MLRHHALPEARMVLDHFNNRIAGSSPPLGMIVYPSFLFCFDLCVDVP
jgi:hypothetical protein